MNDQEEWAFNEKLDRIRSRATAIMAATFVDSGSLRDAYTSEPYLSYLSETWANAYRIAHAGESADAALVERLKKEREVKP